MVYEDDFVKLVDHQCVVCQSQTIALNITGRFDVPEYSSVQDSGTRQEFETGAQRDIQAGKGRYDLLPAHALHRLARHFENGAVKYGDNNWRKGIPTNRYMDSGMRHLVKYMLGDRSEDHLAAAAWNIMCLIETEYMVETEVLPDTLDVYGGAE